MVAKQGDTMVRIDNPAAKTFETEHKADSESESAATAKAMRESAPAAAPAPTIRVRMRETATVRYGNVRPVLLPLSAPQCLVYADAYAKELVLFNLASEAASPVAGTAGAHTANKIWAERFVPV